LNLKALIERQHWLSVELTLEELYPEESEFLEDYRRVYDDLKILEAKAYHLQIVLTICDNHPLIEDEEEETYVDISGIDLTASTNATSMHYAIEFLGWDEWLGMEISHTTLADFSELEIIAHCLHEMTFISFDEDDIKIQLESLKKTVDDYDSMTAEEKEKNTTTLEELKKRLDKNT
jgi:hypothetical protein